MTKADAEGFRRLRVFVASPSDVAIERQAIRRVVDELNLTIEAIAPEKRLFIELVRWETHVAPGLGRPQGVVNDAVSEYDVFVGILWRRMGTPTGVADSGTQEEFMIAKSRWEKNRTLPVLLYFCQVPFPPPRTLDEVEQLSRVVSFKGSLATSGLIAEYDSHEAFADMVRPHLLLAIGRLASAAPLTNVVDAAARADAASTRRRIDELSARYEGIRSTMLPGGERTRAMEVVASSMRSHALAGYTLIDELITSESAGHRLAAVSFLEVTPDIRHVDWLGARLSAEAPFIGYHAALALLAATRTLEPKDLPTVEAAIERAQASLAREVQIGTDRSLVLQQARVELSSRQFSAPSTEYIP